MYWPFTYYKPLILDGEMKHGYVVILPRFSWKKYKYFRTVFKHKYSSIQMKCQGGNKYALSITVKFDQSTRKFGRISFARLFKFTKHIALLFYLLSPYLLSCMRSSRNVRTNMHIIKTITKLCAHRSTVYGEFRRRWNSNSVSQVCAVLQRPIISKCQHSAKFGNMVHIKFSLIFANLCWLQNKTFSEY